MEWPGMTGEGQKKANVILKSRLYPRQWAGFTEVDADWKVERGVSTFPLI